MSQSNNWTEYWRNESFGGEVFVDDAGHKHQGLGHFWREQFSRIKGRKRIIDLASGAGSIFSNLPKVHQYELHAADISCEALKQLKKRLPKVKTYVCSADKVPLEERSVDLVVSQFGIEYAGIDAYAEASRILSPGGSLIVLCHIAQGYIDSNNNAELTGAQLAMSLDFVNKATKVVEYSFDDAEGLLKEAFDEFVLIEPKLAEYVHVHPKGVHAHLYHGFRQMFVRREHYAREDIVNWLNAMQLELEKSLLRLGEMRRVAANERTMEEIRYKLEEQGMEHLAVSPLTLPGHKLPVAWQLYARKSEI